MAHELKTGGDCGYLRIATEEAFATREQIDTYLRMVKDGTADKGVTSLWGFYARSPSERATTILERLLDLGSQRLRHMDETGIDKAVLALSRSPTSARRADSRSGRTTTLPRTSRHTRIATSA
jgi:2,3-dihydroxybenzoate decarboxylase